MPLGRRSIGLLLSALALLAPATGEGKPPPQKVTRVPHQADHSKPRARVEKKTGKPRPRAGATTKKPAAARKGRAHPNPFLEVPPAGVSEGSPAYTYANLDNDAAFAELDRRGVPYQREDPGPEGVRAPIRLTGPLHGVDVHSALPAAERATSRYEVLDARLALALDDFCALLAEHEMVELVHYTMYRPGAAPRSASDSLPTRHPGGLAIDLGALRRRDGRWFDVGQVWRTDIGKKTCGAGAKRHADPRAQELVALVCDAAAKRLFHYVLTPHYDKAHHDHLHLEIKPAVKWFLVN